MERDVGRECHREYVTLVTEGGVASLDNSVPASEGVILHSLSCHGNSFN